VVILYNVPAQFISILHNFVYKQHLLVLLIIKMLFLREDEVLINLWRKSVRYL